jgi:carboxyl-terminal processing protease
MSHLKRVRLVGAVVAVVVVAACLTAGIALAQRGSHANPLTRPTAHRDPPPCKRAAETSAAAGPPSTPPVMKPTTITTLQQAYECIFAHYYSGSRLDDRALLTTGFKKFTEELQRRGLDQAQATLPKLTGDRAHRADDWAAFAKTYRNVLAVLPNDAALRQALAAATMNGMIEALHDNHNEWNRGEGSAPPSGLGFETAFEGRPDTETPPKDIRDATGPMYLSAVTPESPAANAGLKPGDTIEAVNDVPLFVNGKLTPGALDLLHPKPGQDTVKLTLHRPATDETFTVELQQGTQPPTATAMSATLLDGDIAYVVLPSFYDPTDDVLKKIAELRATAQLRGVILDVRGNGGGRAEEVSKLLGAFAHGKVWSWDCDIKSHCTPHRTDDSVALLNLPLVALTDGRCASACDAFSAAVKDLRLGKLVGARTAGVVSALPTGYRLDDDSLLGLTETHQVAANREIVNDIGVAVDYQAPMTARDLSSGRDPGVDKALALLTK